jgi:hypothetical protein
MPLMVENFEGEMVPAIPIPLLSMWGYRCYCGMWFWRTRNYQGHYALVHILKRHVR